MWELANGEINRMQGVVPLTKKKDNKREYQQNIGNNARGIACSKKPGTTQRPPGKRKQSRTRRDRMGAQTQARQGVGTQFWKTTLGVNQRTKQDGQPGSRTKKEHPKKPQPQGRGVRGTRKKLAPKSVPVARGKRLADTQFEDAKKTQGRRHQGKKKHVAPAGGKSSNDKGLYQTDK